MLGNQQLIGITLLLQGEPEAALDAIQREAGSGWRQIGLAMAYHALGRVEESDVELAWSIDVTAKVASYNIAYTLAFRGEADRAFEWLDKAIDYRDSGLSHAANLPMFADLHSDPRWALFLEKIGRSPKQLAAINFNVGLPE